MAEREATIVLRYKSDFAEAQAEYDAYVKKIEANPIGLRAGSRSGETATFANPSGVAPMGGVPTSTATGRNPYQMSPGEFGVYQATARVVGGAGTGFDRGGYSPVASAAYNTVYGGVDPRVIQPSLLRPASIPPMVLPPPKPSPNTIPATTGSAGSVIAGGIAGAAAFGVGAMAAGGTALYAANQTIESLVQARYADRFNSPIERAQQEYQRAAGQNWISRSVIGSANFLANAVGFDRPFFDQAQAKTLLQAAAADERYNESRAVIRGMDRSARLIGTDGISQRIGGIQNARDNRVEQLAREQNRIGATVDTGIGREMEAVKRNAAMEIADELKRFGSSLTKEFEAGLTSGLNADRRFFSASFNQLRSSQSAENRSFERSAALLSPESRNQARSILGFRQSEDRRALFESAAFEVRQRRLDNEASTSALIAQSERRFFDAQRTTIRRSAQREIDALDASSPDAGALLQSIAARRDAAMRLATTQENRDTATSALASYSNAVASRLRTAGRPLEAEETQIRNSFQQRIRDVDPGSPNAVRSIFALAREREAAISEARFNFGFQTQQIQTSQRLEGASLDRLLARDQVGATAFGIAGGAATSIASLQVQGRSAEAEAERANALKRIAVLQNEYTLGFRGENFDAQNMLINNPRDSQDPGEVFQQIDAARREVENANAKPVPGVAGGEVLSSLLDELKGFYRMVEEALR